MTLNMYKSEIETWTRIDFPECSVCHGTNQVHDDLWCCVDDSGPYRDKECDKDCHYPFQNMTDEEIQGLADWEINLLSGIEVMEVPNITPATPHTWRYCCNNGECDGHDNEENTDMSDSYAETDNGDDLAYWGPKMDAPGMLDWETAARFLMNHMDMDTRGKFMTELPGVYNRIIGKEIVTVRRTEDNTPIKIRK